MKKFFWIIFSLLVIVGILIAVVPAFGWRTRIDIVTPDNEKVTLNFGEITKVDANNYVTNYSTRRSEEEIFKNLEDNGIKKIMDLDEDGYLISINDKYLYCLFITKSGSKNLVGLSAMNIDLNDAEFLDFPNKENFAFWRFIDGKAYSNWDSLEELKNVLYCVDDAIDCYSDIIVEEEKIILKSKGHTFELTEVIHEGTNKIQIEYIN